jgi:hypothetical protein
MGLSPVTEEVLNPLICFSCDPIMFQLMNDKAISYKISSDADAANLQQDLDKLAE